MREYISFDFGILHLEVPPESTPHELLGARPTLVVLHVVHQVVVFQLPIGGQCPFGHLAVAGIGQVDLAPGRRAGGRLGQRRGVQPVPIGRQRLQKRLQPAVLVDVLLRVRPRPELLAVVAKHDDRVGEAIGDPAQVLDRLVRRRKRDQVPQSLTARETRSATDRRPRSGSSRAAGPSSVRHCGNESRPGSCT